MNAITLQTNKLRLTKKAVEGLIVERRAALAEGREDGSRRYWDTELPGFYLQFTPAGIASYCVRYHKPSGEKGDFTIARAALVGPEQARESAREHLARLRLNGEDPVEARLARRDKAQQAKELTFEKIARKYVEARKKQRPDGRKFIDEEVLEKYVFPEFGRLHIDRITIQMVKDLVLETQVVVAKRNVGHEQGRAGKVTANKVHGAVRRVYAYAVASEKTDRNPGAAFKRQFSSKPAKRKGVVTEERLHQLWLELEEKAEITLQTTPLAIQLYILTLQRPIDIARARRAHFDFAAKEWNIPWDLTKTEAPYTIPMSDPVMELVERAFALTDSEYLFPGAAYRMSHIRACSMRARFKTAVDDLTTAGRWPEGRRMHLYDVRRFGRTQLVHKLGYSKEVAERVINHAELESLDELYDVHEYDEELRQAHVAWGEEVLRIVRGGGQG